MYFLWDIFVNTIEWLLVFLFMRHIAGAGSKRKQTKAIIATMILIVLQSFLNFMSFDGYIVVIIMSLSTIAYGATCFSNSLSVRILGSCLSMTIFAVANQTVTFIMVKTALGSLSLLSHPSAARMIPTSMYLLLLATLFALANRLPHVSFELPRQMQLLLISLGVLTAVLSGILQSAVRITASSDGAQALYEIFLLPISIFFVVFFASIYLVIHYAQQSQERTLAYKNAIWQMETNREQQELLRRWVHDERHHLAALNEYAIEGNLGELKNYLNEISASLDASVSMQETGNSAIDAALSRALTAAKKDDIPMQLHLCRIKVNPLTDVETVALIGNLAENALDAANEWRNAGREGAKITMAVEVRQKMLYITSRNPSLAREIDETGRYLSTKGRGHGYGLKSIESIANGADGFMETGFESGTFIVEVWIPLERRSQWKG